MSDGGVCEDLDASVTICVVGVEDKIDCEMSVCPAESETKDDSVAFVDDSAG